MSALPAATGPAFPTRPAKAQFADGSWKSVSTNHE
jgi:hypothetical protein